MSHSQAQDLVPFLIQQAVPIGTIEGPWEAAEEFSRRWSISTQSSADTQMDQGLYELTTVEMPASEGGCLIQVQEEHRSILHSFVMGFLSIFPSDAMTPRAVDQRVGRFIDEKRAYLWQQEDQTFVSMAAIVRETPHTSSISWVYTPPQYRRKGHAAQAVANLSKAQLDAGKHACNLHTDLNNPTSNSVYRGIGFKMIARSLRISMSQQ